MNGVLPEPDRITVLLFTSQDWNYAWFLFKSGLIFRLGPRFPEYQPGRWAVIQIRGFSGSCCGEVVLMKINELEAA